MNKKNIPVIYRNKKGYVEYKLVTKSIPFWDISKYLYFGWHPIWIFKASPLNITSADSPEHIYALSDINAVKNANTYGELQNLVRTLDNEELTKFEQNRK